MTTAPTITGLNTVFEEQHAQICNITDLRISSYELRPIVY